MKLKPILISGEVKHHHIILVDAEAMIEEGDWYLHHGFNNSFSKQAELKDLKSITASDQPKIIASTTSSHNLPLLSAKATSILIDYYNKNKCMPEFVDVETYNPNINKETPSIHTNCEIKLNQEGTIDITIPEKEKLYTEDEVRETSIKFFYHWYNSPGNNTEQGFDEWFNENKK